MITVTITETNGHRKWSHSARTKDALTAILRTMNKHFPLSHNFIPDDIDNAPVLFAAVASTPDVIVTGHIWTYVAEGSSLECQRYASNRHAP
ncbi:hypothetical protein [Kosakonia pseudosacchari]|uniref:hypothetical protein n=1 Tax=Kosakonia pseudosacchari TaxID=1646340 RepID=UPI001D14B894|nr:hypothetical protein [Kosakonia pseudosacchari]